jgi:RNA polymerase sigma-70 factor, ECF subfamily
MATSFPQVSSRTSISLSTEKLKERYRRVYDKRCRRIYSLAFWMTDDEIAAERLASRTFLRAFDCGGSTRTQQIDQAFVAEVRELTQADTFTLDAAVARVSKSIYGNMKRIHLERAVMQLPAAERLIFLFHDVEAYDHARIGQLLGFSEDQVKIGLHQARMRIRELVICADALACCGIPA